MGRGVGDETLNMEMADLRAEFEDVVFVYGSRLAQDGMERRQGNH